MWPVIDSSVLIDGKYILKNPLQDLPSSLDAVISTNESKVILLRGEATETGRRMKFRWTEMLV